MDNPPKFTHIIESQQFSGENLEDIFESARRIERNGYFPKFANKIMVTLFYEPSTRTRMSFEIAMARLGGHVISTENASDFSSAIKGESLEDTIRVISGYKPDVIVLRHKEEGSARRAAAISPCPIINAGDGNGQHPTQALLDLYTINKKLGRLHNLKIAMVGDLLNGRTVRSLSYLLGKFKEIEIHFVSPDFARMKNDIKDYLKRHGVKFTETRDLREVASFVDVIYQTRTQRERGMLDFDRAGENGYFTVDGKTLEMMKRDAIIMHPLPRNNEISPEVDKDPRAAYFEQSDNGLYIRMALLRILFS